MTKSGTFGAAVAALVASDAPTKAKIILMFTCSVRRLHDSQSTENSRE